MAHKPGTPVLAMADQSSFSTVSSINNAPHQLLSAEPICTFLQTGRPHHHHSKLCIPPSSSSHLSHRRGLLLGSVAGVFSSNSLNSKEGPLLGHARLYSSGGPIQVDSPHPPTLVWAPDRRIIAVGDLHGDIGQCRRALTLAGILSTDGQDKWVGGNAVLVQVGDVLDRGGDEIAIMSLLRWLNLQAQLKGGAVFQVNGNHETMNVEGDFRYVDPTGFYEANNFAEFCEEEHDGNWKAAFAEWWHISEKRKSTQCLSFEWMPWNLLKVQKGVSVRSILFSPGGPLAQELSRHGVVLQVNDWVFAHGGILPHHVEYGLQRINKEVSQWMQGTRDSATSHPARMPFIATRGFDSIVWSRLYSRETFEKPEEGVRVCAVLKSALDAIGAKGLVVGHTPQTSGANSKCQGQIWRIDVGMSRGMLNAKPQVLEIVNNEARILSSASKGTCSGNDDPSQGLSEGFRHYTTI